MRVIVDERPGNSSYLVEVGDGRAFAIDPLRDPAPYLRAAAASVLERAGRRDLTVLLGGSRDWSKATGQLLERS